MPQLNGMGKSIKETPIWEGASEVLDGALERMKQRVPYHHRVTFNFSDGYYKKKEDEFLQELEGGVFDRSFQEMMENGWD